MSDRLTDRDREMLDRRVMTEIHKEKIARDAAIRERVREAERRRTGGTR